MCFNSFLSQKNSNLIHQKLRDLYKKESIPEFAKSSFFENKFQPQVIERRRTDLERYLNALLTGQKNIFFQKKNQSNTI